MADLGGKTAIVTGAGRGIGRGIALALAAGGSAVVVAGRSLGPLEAVRSEIQDRGHRAVAVVCDVGEPDQLTRLVETTLTTYGAIDILVNNAAHIPHGSLLALPEAELERGWTTGPVAALRLMRLCHPHLRGGGAIVNVSSSESLGPSAAEQGLYGALKAALNVISRTAAIDWGRDGIRVNQVMPWAASDAVTAWMASQPADAAKILARTPLQRLGDPEADVGTVVAFLCSDQARYVTGTTIPVDGGSAFLR